MGGKKKKRSEICFKKTKASKRKAESAFDEWLVAADKTNGSSWLGNKHNCCLDRVRHVIRRPGAPADYEFVGLKY